jgi:predicted NBD/HSP70 family sugar kinase
MKLLLDLGGTSMRFAVGASHPVPPFAVERTPGSLEEIASRIECRILEVQKERGDPVDGLAIATPGLVDPDGHVSLAVHVPFTGVHVRRELESLLHVPVTVLNDAQAQAYGAATPGESLTYIVLGTAVGGAHVVDGEVLAGHHGTAGEIGHIPIPGVEGICACGRWGCLENVAGGWRIEEALGSEWWVQGPSAERDRVLHRAGSGVGVAAAICSTLLDPSRVVVVGRVTQFEAFRGGAREGWDAHRMGEAGIEFFPDSWPFAWSGLKRAAERLPTRR